jgi:hypothetical protein
MRNRVFYGLCGGAVTLIVLVALAVNYATRDFWNLEFPLYLTAVGTISATLAALGLALAGERRRAAQRRDDALAEARREARRVVALCGTDADVDDAVWLVVRNLSSAAVHDVRLTAGYTVTDAGSPDPPWTWIAHDSASSFRATLAAGAQWRPGGAWSPGSGAPGRPPTTAQSQWFAATIEWTDLDGVRWRRDGGRDVTRLGQQA